MRKIVSFLSLSILSAKLTLAQVAVPMANYSFNGFPATPAPNGSTYNLTTGGELYNSTGSAATVPSLKLQATGQYFQLHTATSPGAVTYAIRANIGGTATQWDGTFDVQQSTDGNSWNVLPNLKKYTGPGGLISSGNFYKKP